MYQITIFCDRCGIQMYKDDHPLFVENWTKHASQYTRGGSQKYDFCPECRKAFDAFLKNKSAQN